MAQRKRYTPEFGSRRMAEMIGRDLHGCSGLKENAASNACDGNKSNLSKAEPDKG